MPPFILDKLDEIHRHALEQYPFECCGIIIGKEDNDQEDILYPCRNIQNEKHEEDPENFPRDARTAFFIDPKDLLKIQNEARAKDMLVKVFYHSHPDHDAYFSDEDKRMALIWDEPAYPGAQYLVVSVVDRKIKTQALFAWNSEAKAFDEVQG